MKRYLYLFPLMAVTAATLALGACDDNKADETAPADQAAATAPETTADTAASTTVTTPAAAMNVMDAKSFATAPGMTNGAVFLTLQNPGTETDKLIGATTGVAASAEIHETSMDSATGTMQMRKVDGVEIGAGQMATLSPDGYHIMLLGLTAPLTAGQSFPITLDFEKAPDVVVDVSVTTAGTPAGAPADPAFAPTTETTPTEAAPDATTTPETMTPPAEGSLPTDEVTPDASATDATSSAEPVTTEPATDEAPEEPTVQ